MQLRIFRGLRGFSAGVLFVFTVLGAGHSAWATSFQSDPPCMSDHQPLPINNDQMAEWKMSDSVPNGWHGRGNAEGTVVQVNRDQTGHNHFLIQLDGSQNQTLEIIYNQDFGALPDIQPGMQIHACGDWIKSVAQNGPYPPSPAGAILHWVHESNNLGRHENGYVVVDGVLYGNGPERKAHYRRRSW